MQLKLADYGEKKEKFERFLELGKDFFYGGDLIKIQKGGEVKSLPLTQFEDILSAIENHEDLNNLCEMSDLFLNTYDKSYLRLPRWERHELKKEQEQKLIALYESAEKQFNTDFNLNLTVGGGVVAPYNNTKQRLAQRLIECNDMTIRPDKYQTYDQHHLKIFDQFKVDYNDNFSAKIIALHITGKLSDGAIKRDIFKDNSFLQSPPKLISTYEHPIKITEITKDEKDPLNRFNGLFNGRTYGEGRFVLIEISENKIAQDDVVNFGGWTKLIKKSTGFTSSGTNNDYYTVWSSGLRTSTNYEKSEKMKAIGNLHQNPELWESASINITF